MQLVSLQHVRGAIVGFVMGVVVLGVYGHALSRDVKTHLDGALHELETQFILRAEQADRIESTNESTASVRDCSSRARFESLLSSLQSLTQSERAELDLLFAQCGDYHARLKSYYVQELAHSVARYEELVRTHDTLLAHNVRHDRVLDAMKSIHEGERERAGYLYEQVALQGELNASYRKQVDARSIEDILTDGTALGGNLVKADSAIDTARAALQSL